MPILIKDDIERLIAVRRRALLYADADALARLLHPHYRYVDSLGRVLPREAYLASRRSREVEFDRHEITELEVRELESPPRSAGDMPHPRHRAIPRRALRGPVSRRAHLHPRRR